MRHADRVGIVTPPKWRNPWFTWRSEYVTLEVYLPDVVMVRDQREPGCDPFLHVALRGGQWLDVGWGGLAGEPREAFLAAWQAWRAP